MTIAALLAAGCATVPPARAVTDKKMVAGTWTGTISARNATHAYTVIINEDGTYQGTSPTLPPGRFEGTWQVSDGKMLWKSSTTGRTGSSTLHEGDGKRMMQFTLDDGSATAELTPAK